MDTTITKALTRKQLELLVMRLEESSFRLEHAINYCKNNQPDRQDHIARMQRKLDDNNELLFILRGR